MEAAQQGIDDAQKASQDDTKSSAGDKYETGRAMMQQETDRNLMHLNQANKLKIVLNNISPNITSGTAETGAVVFTDKGNFYIAISAGLLRVGNESYIAISAASPIGVKLKGLKSGQIFSLNDTHYRIIKIF